MKHPIQKPIMVDEVLRFTENSIVSLMLMMLENEGKTLNEVHTLGRKLPKEDWEQFNQLIGYSLSGAPISEGTREAAYSMHENEVDEYRARAELAENELNRIKKDLREPMARLFNMCPEDLEQ